MEIIKDIEFILAGILFLLFLIFFLFYTVQLYNLLFRGFAPFYSTKKKIIESIVNKLELTDGGQVVELGCGRAGFLETVRRKYPRVKLVGYEHSFLPYLIARLQQSLKGTKLNIVRKNIFQADLSQADVIYCYLNINTMKRLEEKFKKECKSGARIISYMFFLPNLKPDHVEDVAKGEKVYYYTME